MCKEKYHENEALEYYYQQCKVCICIKCRQTRHGHHPKVEIQQAAEERKVPMANVLDISKAEVVAVESKIKEQIELRNKSRARGVAAQNKIKEVVERLIRVLRDQEMAIEDNLNDINEEQEAIHAAKLAKLQTIVTELKSLIEHGESIYKRGIGLEILQEEHVFGSLKQLLNDSKKMKLYRPKHVNFVVKRGTVADLQSLLPLGQVVTSSTDHLQSVAEGKGLTKADCGTETDFTVTTRDSEGNQTYHEQDQVTVLISSPTGEEEVHITDCEDGNYTVHYKPTSVGRHNVRIEVNGWPLTGTPWSFNVTPHHYKVVSSCGSRGQGQGEFNGPVCITRNETTGNIAVADYGNKRIQLFDDSWNYLKTIGDEEGSGTDAVKIGHPMSVAFSSNGDILVTHQEQTPHAEEMSAITDRGQFIKNFGEHLLKPISVFVKTDGHVVVCDVGDKKIKVLSPDGAKILHSFCAPNCKTSPDYFACYYHNKFFVSYPWARCVKVFNEEGVFLYDVGCEGSGEEQLCCPRALAVDAFGNLIVCDTGNKKLKVFTLDGKFLTWIGEEIKSPWFVTVCNNGDVMVSDLSEDCIHVLQ